LIHTNRHKISGETIDFREARTLFNEQFPSQLESQEKTKNRILQNEVQDQDAVETIKKETAKCVSNEMTDIILNKKGNNTLDDAYTSRNACVEQVGNKHGLSPKAKADLKREMNPGTMDLPYEGISEDMSSIWTAFQKTKPFIGNGVKVVSAKKIKKNIFRLSVGTLFKDSNNKDAVDVSDFTVDITNSPPTIMARGSDEQIKELINNKKFDKPEDAEEISILPSVIFENGKFIRTPEFSVEPENLSTVEDINNSTENLPGSVQTNESDQRTTTNQDCEGGVCITPPSQKEIINISPKGNIKSIDVHQSDIPEYIQKDLNALNNIKNRFNTIKGAREKGFKNPLIIIVSENCSNCTNFLKHINNTLNSDANTTGIVIIDKESQEIPHTNQVRGELAKGTPMSYREYKKDKFIIQSGNPKDEDKKDFKNKIFDEIKPVS